MDTRVCGHCGGSGECFVLRHNAGISSAADELVMCSACHGDGQVPLEPVRLMLSRPDRKVSPRNSPAMKAAIAAVKRHMNRKR